VEREQDSVAWRRGCAFIVKLELLLLGEEVPAQAGVAFSPFLLESSSLEQWGWTQVGWDSSF
jgi:hypothetical protein